MCIYIYIYLYACIGGKIDCVCMRACGTKSSRLSSIAYPPSLLAHPEMWVYVYMYISIYLCIYLYTCMCVCTYMYIHIQMAKLTVCVCVCVEHTLRGGGTDVMR